MTGPEAIPEDKNPFQPLIMKAGEYFQCARHLNLRGLADVVEECKVMVEAHKLEGRTFDDFIAGITELAQGHAPPADDPWIKVIKQAFGEV